LPIGGLAGLIVIIFFRTPENAQPAQASFKEKMLQMDFAGAALMMTLIISYILALQYGGQTHPWNSSVVIGLLVGFVAMLVVFVGWEIFLQERAMIVPRLVSQYTVRIPVARAKLTMRLMQIRARYVSVGSAFMFFFGGAYFTVLYYLPIYFQSIHNDSPIGSGVKMLALIVPLTVAAIVQGFALIKIGIVPLFWVVGGALATVGCGLFHTMDAETSTGKWIGYQIIVGFMVGWTFQVALANGQMHANPKDMSQVTAIINCEYKIPNSSSNLIADVQLSLRHDRWLVLLIGSPECFQQRDTESSCRQASKHQSGDCPGNWSNPNP
jgi:MFS transporter, DHA2 family, glioxin efflux transporter